MRALLLSLFVGVVLSAPQGYNYQQVQVPPAAQEFTPQQYELLQQYAQQQEQQKQLLQQQIQQELQLQYQQQQQQQLLQQQQQQVQIQLPVAATHEAIATPVIQASDNGGYQYTNQLVQQAQQYQQQQQQFQVPVEVVPTPEVATPSQTVSQAADNGGYQFANQLVQQAQQYQQQQQQLQVPVAATKEVVPTPEVATQSQTVSQAADNGGYQFANQLVQQAHQLVHYEQQQNQKTDAAVLQNNIATPIAEVQQQQSLPPQQHSEEAAQRVPEKLTPVAEPLPQPLPQSEATYQPPQQQHELPRTPTISRPQPLVQPQYQPAPQQSPSQVQYKKEFYYLSAPQEDNEQPQNLQDQLNSFKKNLRVVFIKAPENNGLTNAALQLAKQSIDAQTAIYVLTKQHNAADLANKLQEIRGGAQAKPEVVFVKYRTPEEAEQAQRNIQAQYEALDGPNHFNQADVAPSHNFASGSSTGIDPRFGGASSSSSSDGESSSSSASPNAKYLPAAAKH